MKSALFVLAALAFVAFANAAPVNARYLKFEGYYSSPNGSVGIHEIEAYANGLNAARNAAVTVNSGSSASRVTDGNTTNLPFVSNQNSPGPASEAVPHWVQIDLGSVKPLDRIKVYLSSPSVSYGLFLSSDGTNWTQFARNDLVTGTVESDPSAPFVKIQSAQMRPGTTLMDVVYRVTDPDDTTVKTRALAFVDGVRSFANILKPVTLVEGTAAKLGDAIPVNVDHTLTWDVATDWNIDLGQIKFEVLALDQRGLLSLDWIAIPAAGGHQQTTVSKNSPTNADVLNALFWQYADGDTGLTLANGMLSGNSSNGVFNGVVLANSSTLQTYSTPFIFKRMNLDVDDGVVATAARAGLTTPQGWHAANRAYAGTIITYAWGNNNYSQATIPASLGGVVSAVAAGSDFNLVLKSDGTVVGWGDSNSGKSTIPVGLNGVIAITAGSHHSLALKSDGTVVGWGNNYYGQTAIPAGLSSVTAIAGGLQHSLALKSDGTVVGWGKNDRGQVTGTANPTGPTYNSVANPVVLVTGVIAIAAGYEHSLALKSDGTVVAWGYNSLGQTTIPAGLSGVIAIAAGGSHSLALKSDGTVVGWGNSNYGQNTIPVGLGEVSAIAEGGSFSLALKSDGTVVSWGKIYNSSSSWVPMITPSGLSGVTAISGGVSHSLILKAKAR